METPIPLSALHTLTHSVAGHTFIISVPTQLMKAKLGFRLYELGVIQVSPATLRAVVVSEMFHVLPEDEAEEAADLLHQFWTDEDEHTLAMDRWRQKDVQRVLDFADGAPRREPEPQPVNPVTARTRYKVQELMDLVNDNSRRYRQTQSRRLDFENANARMMLRLAIVGCKSKGVKLEVEPVDQILTEGSLEAIQQAVGAEGVQSLVRFVNSQYGLGEEDKETFSSPGASESAPTGSTEQSDASESSDGSSTSTTKTASSTTPAPDGASESGTGRRSARRSYTKGQTGRRGRTGAAG